MYEIYKGTYVNLQVSAGDGTQSYLFASIVPGFTMHMSEAKSDAMLEVIFEHMSKIQKDPAFSIEASIDKYSDILVSCTSAINEFIAQGHSSGEISLVFPPETEDAYLFRENMPSDRLHDSTDDGMRIYYPAFERMLPHSTYMQ